MIQKANLSQIPVILNLTQACAHQMIQKGIHQWNAHYPSREAFVEDIKRDELFLFVKDENIIGTLVLSTLKDAVYEPVNWLTPSDSRSLYIHRLAVHPDHQGQGIAQQLMNYAEDFARENGYTSIRLDTFSKNDRNNTFYTQRGYVKLEEIYFPKQSAFPFYCYELVL